MEWGGGGGGGGGRPAEGGSVHVWLHRLFRLDGELGGAASSTGPENEMYNRRGWGEIGPRKLSNEIGEGLRAGTGLQKKPR